MEEVKKTLQFWDLNLKICLVFTLILASYLIGLKIGMQDAINAMTTTGMPSVESWPWYWHLTGRQWLNGIGTAIVIALVLIIFDFFVNNDLNNIRIQHEIDTAPPDPEGGMQG